VRYADDFVVLARYVGPKITGYIEDQLENRFGLEINREKTRVVNLKEKGASLDFLGFTFRYDNDLKGRPLQYLNVIPSAKALNYFRFGYPRKAFREINWYIRYRLKQHLRRRSQRPFRPPEGSTYYDHLDKIGLRSL
jgi:RNA-directed DNA polymerase